LRKEKSTSLPSYEKDLHFLKREKRRRNIFEGKNR